MLSLRTHGKTIPHIPHALAMTLLLYIVGAVMTYVGTLNAQTSNGMFFVSGNMDIYGAGGYNDGSNGVEPFSHTFRARPHQFVSFSNVGLWTCADGAANPAPWGPDGTRAAVHNHCYGYGASIINGHFQRV
jgi:hypothetical protein